MYLQWHVLSCVCIGTHMHTPIQLPSLFASVASVASSVSVASVASVASSVSVASVASVASLLHLSLYTISISAGARPQPPLHRDVEHRQRDPAPRRSVGIQPVTKDRDPDQIAGRDARDGDRWWKWWKWWWWWWWRYHTECYYYCYYYYYYYYEWHDEQWQGGDERCPWYMYVYIHIYICAYVHAYV